MNAKSDVHSVARNDAILLESAYDMDKLKSHTLMMHMIVEKAGMSSFYPCSRCSR
jgi:hypothetical protein